jgi:glucose/arabinose dehydrogenase
MGWCVNRGTALVVLVGMWLAVNSPPAAAGLAGTQRVATGLNAPIFTAQAPGDPNRLFVAERNGAIRIVDLTTGTVSGTPFLTISGVDAAGEGGFRGFAFHPDYETNGKLYVNVTIDNGGQNFLGATSPFSVHIREYTTDPAVPSPSRTTTNAGFTPIIDIVHPHSNHHAGWIGFSPNDGYLYIPTGDGGGNGNDLDNDGSDTDGDVGGHTQGTGNAQDRTNNLLGKVLRLDVNGDEFPAANRNYAIPPTNPYTAAADANDDEIWAYGMRNPFRASFDRANGDLWIGDVGQGAREEVDRQLGSSAGGENYGWRLREGAIQTPNAVAGGPKPPGNVDPVYDYGRTGPLGGNIVIGGQVYRGPDPTLQGKYIFADQGANKFWMFDPANPYGTITDIKSMLTPNVGSFSLPVAFGEDASGNIYITDLAGSVYRIKTNALTPGDFDADADVDADDLAAWTAGYGMASGATAANGDADADGDVDGADFLAWQRNLGWSALNAATPAGAGVPEPTGALLAFSLCAAAVAARRRRL